MLNRRGTRTIYVTLIVVVLAVTIWGLYLASSSNESDSQITYPLTFVDSLGRNVTFTSQPERIISVIPSTTETIFVLGAGDKVVGVTRFDVYPPELVRGLENGSIISVGSGRSIDIEKVVALDPDVIFVGREAFFSTKSITKLEELGFTIVSVHSKSIDGLLQNIELLGRILDQNERSEQLSEQISEKIDSILSRTKDAPKVKVYLENWPDPMFTIGSGSIQDEMLEISGGTNVFSDLTGSTQVNLESVIVRNPDVIIYFHDRITPDEMKKRPGWNAINAVRDNMIFQLDIQEGAANPRIPDSLEKLARFIHPELFEIGQSLESIFLTHHFTAVLTKN